MTGCLKEDCSDPWYECCWSCNCTAFRRWTDNIKQAKQKEHHTSRRNVNRESEEWELTYFEQPQQFISKWMSAQRSDFIRFLRNLCAGMIFLWPLTQTSLNITALSRDSTLGCSNNWYLGTIELKMANIPKNSFKQMFGYWNEAPRLSPVVPRSTGRGSTNPHARFFRWVLTKEKLKKCQRCFCRSSVQLCSTLFSRTSYLSCVQLAAASDKGFLLQYLWMQQ